MSWPKYFKDNLIIGDSDSEIGIVTLWTPVNKIVDRLDRQSFALAGQLYSKEGINFIIRNILANPKIRYLIVCGEERVGSGRALINFIEKGVKQDHSVKETDYCFIHKEIPIEKLEQFRQNVKIANLMNQYEPAVIAEKIKAYSPVGLSWAEPEIFEDAKVEFDGVMPSDQSVFKIRKKYAGEVWLDIMKKIMKFGTIRESFHGNNCKELFNIAAVVTNEDPENFKIFPYFQLAKEDFENYLPKFMTGERGTADYTYGERLWNFPKIDGRDFKYNQIDEVIVDYLNRYPTDRAACATIFGIQDHTAKSSPCMTFLQATNVDEKIELTVYFRSHDIFGAWLLNVYGLRHLQKYIADKLKTPLGNLNVISNCAHIYDNNWPIAKNLIAKYGNELVCQQDPRGYLIIKVEDKKIVIKHYSPNGKILQEFKQDGTVPKATMRLYNILVQNDVVSLIAHAFDIGSELMKAEIAVKNNISYTQDQELKF